MSRCEYDPENKRPATNAEGCPNEAAISVGAQGQWHLCEGCAALPEFDRYRTRKALRRDEPAPSTHSYVPHPKHPWFCRDCGYPEHEKLKHEAASVNTPRR